MLSVLETLEKLNQRNNEMRILVLGDRITDQYSFCKATRLCPEAPAPVLVVEKQRTSSGGAALVAEQLKVLAGNKSVSTIFGSFSEKHRIFCDRQLVCRIDRDSMEVLDSKDYWVQIKHIGADMDAIVVGDYGKGAMRNLLPIDLVKFCNEKKIPLFVDAKTDPVPYRGCFAIFPNENEHNSIKVTDYQHIIRKLGPRGCSVNGLLVPTKEQQVYDVTGAGDIFLAGFVYRWLGLYDHPDKMKLSADYANQLAGISVRHLGTYVVQIEDLGE